MSLTKTFTTYETTRLVGNPRKRTRQTVWSIYENDGSEEGRCVCNDLTDESEADLIAEFLNATEGCHGDAESSGSMAMEGGSAVGLKE